MRFLDYNGSGGLDSQDIATSIAVESSRDDEEDDAATSDASWGRRTAPTP